MILLFCPIRPPNASEPPWRASPARFFATVPRHSRPQHRCRRSLRKRRGRPRRHAQGDRGPAPASTRRRPNQGQFATVLPSSRHASPELCCGPSSRGSNRTSTVPAGVSSREVWPGITRFFMLGVTATPSVQIRISYSKTGRSEVMPNSALGVAAGVGVESAEDVCRSGRVCATTVAARPRQRQQNRDRNG